MDDGLIQQRNQMGRSLALLSQAGPRPFSDSGDGFWIAFSGVESPDSNVALIATNDPAVLEHVRRVIDDESLPATIALAGAARAVDLGESWHYQGDMPLLELVLADANLKPDSRVRAASSPDVDTISELLASAYSISREESDAVAAFAAMGRTDGTFWLLVDERPVATVFTAVVDDAVCVWSLATPEQYARRGYARALLDDVLARARDDGARNGLLSATPAGVPLYARAGWRTIETWRLFTRSSETP